VGQHPPKSNRGDPICFSPYLYCARNPVERFFNRITQCRRVATHYDRLAGNYLAFVQLASIRLWLAAHVMSPSRSWGTPAGYRFGLSRIAPALRLRPDYNAAQVADDDILNVRDPVSIRQRPSCSFAGTITSYFPVNGA
jgi:hypothetical protein